MKEKTRLKPYKPFRAITKFLLKFNSVSYEIVTSILTFLLVKNFFLTLSEPKTFKTRLNY